MSLLPSPLQRTIFASAIRLAAMTCAFALPLTGVSAWSLPRPIEAAAPGDSVSSPRIVEHVDESRLATLKGNTRPEARAEYDRGPVEPSLVMGDLILVLRRSPEQQAAFESFLASQQDKSSPNFHHWLTPDQIGKKYGPAQADLDTVIAWLQNHGFAITYTSKDHLAITFSGAASQVQSAFHTQIHNLEVKGQKHIANVADPQIPEALTPVVVGVKALHNFFARPQGKIGADVRRNADGTWTRLSSTSNTSKAQAKPAASSKSIKINDPRPLFGTGGGTPSNIEDIVPYDFATIYNVLPLWSASTPIDGTGQSVAIAGTSNINLADVATFRSAFGLPVVGSTYPTYKAPKVIITNSDPGVCPTTDANYPNCLGDLIENSLDVEWSGAVAKNAQIILVTSATTTATTDSLFASEQYIVDKVVAPVMNVSYGECELGLGVSGNTEYSNLWSTAEAAGIAVFVATGDTGSASCDAGSAPQDGPYGAQYGLSVSGFASTPYNTAVGGTDFNWSWTNNQSTYWGSSNAANHSNALGYIPESPWNSTCSNYLLVDALNANNNVNYTATEWCDYIGTEQVTSSDPSDEQGLLDLVNVDGGSGGASNCINGDGANTSSCSKGYAKPSWQAGVTGIPSDGVRDIPDVSFFAANGFSGTAYVICVSRTDIGTCSYTQATEPTGEEYGGTSISTPAMAGVMALVNQKAGAAQGNPNVELYKLAAKETYSGCSTENIPLSNSACVFNDIDAGTNAMPCEIGAPNCSGTDAYGILTGYAANTGYDLSSGLGSLNVANFVNAYAGVTPVVSVTLTPSSLTFASTGVGDSAATQTVTLKNTGSGDLTISGITLTGAAASSYSETDTCGSSLSAASTCAITITFSPKSSGTLAASLSIADDATGSPQTVTLSGVGTTPSGPVVSLSPTSLTFGNTLLGSSAATQAVTLTNTGSSALTITGITILGNNPGSFVETNTCGGSVAASAKCVITVTFTPVSSGTLSASINIADNASNAPQTVALSGTSTTPAPAVTLSPTSLTFPSTLVGATATAQTVTLKNTGTSALTVSLVTITGSALASFSETNNCTTVATGATCTLTVKFTPATAGTLTASLNIADNATGTPQSVTLTGTATTPPPPAPVVSLSPTSLTFPSTTVGSTAPTQTITVKNTGNAPLVTTSVATTNGQTGQNYLASTNCGTLAAGATCTITVTFKPTTTGTLTATIALTDNAANSPQTVNITGTGAAPIPSGSFTLSATSPAAVAPGTAAVSTITVTSDGTYAGSVQLACSVAAISGGVDTPTCTVGAAIPVTTSAAGTGTVTVNSTGATSSAKPVLHISQTNNSGRSRGWLAAGGAALAFALFFGIPARRRSWRSLLSILLFMAAIGSISACGGSSHSGSSGTTAGTYTVTVTGTDTVVSTITKSTTFTLTIN